MALMNIFAHASILRPKGRGINPGVIQASMSCASGISVEIKVDGRLGVNLNQLAKK